MAGALVLREWPDLQLPLSRNKTMKMPISKSQRGFSLLEMMVASSIGLIAIMAMTQLFNMGMNATLTVTQRADTQQNMRAAIELMTKDISMAGAGLPSGGLQLANADGSSKVACNQTGTCYVTADTYPLSGSGVANYMYGILPGFGNGVQSAAIIAAAPAAVNDSITSIYCDYNFPLNNFSVYFPQRNPSHGGRCDYYHRGRPHEHSCRRRPQRGRPAAVHGEHAGQLARPPRVPATRRRPRQSAKSPASPTTLRSILRPPTPSISTRPAPTVSPQSPPPSLPAGAETTACRLYAVTYFLQVPPAGGTLQTPRLMRQVNGLTAVPVADGIINLQFSYDVINNTLGTISANQSNPIGAGLSPALIQKVNIWVLGESITQAGKKSQSMYLASSSQHSQYEFLQFL